MIRVFPGAIQMGAHVLLLLGPCHSLAKERKVAGMEKITTDVCEVDFPPVSYGDSLEEIEATIQEVVERIFRDEDGIIRSGVHGRTMKPLRLEEVTDRPYGIGCYSQYHHIPLELRPIFNNYENAIQGSGKYLVAMMLKYRVTGDDRYLDNARRTFSSLELLWNNVAEQNRYPGGRGWMPKPFGGIRHVAEMTETSPDQYTDMTLGLEQFRKHGADGREQQVIDAMILSFADWWMEHDYATSYEGGTCWWKLRTDLSHPISFFLYLNALAYSIRPDQKYQEAFALWESVSGGSPVFRDGDCSEQGVNSGGLSILCMERLMELRPDQREHWLMVLRASAEHLPEVDTLSDSFADGAQGTFQLKMFAAWYLCVSHRVLGDKKFREQAAAYLQEHRARADFYHITRGVPTELYDAIVMGDDYRNMFWSEGHIMWLSTYWYLRQGEHAAGGG